MASVKLADIVKAIKADAKKARSAWKRGVTAYALDLCAKLKERGEKEIITTDFRHLLDLCLNGARDWKHYSEGGWSLIYDADIVERLCTDGEKRRYNEGKLERPNAYEATWLDAQARALYQAYWLICEKVHDLTATDASAA